MNLSEKTEPDDAAAPRKRISWFAWVMTVLVAGCLLVMNSRGELDQDSTEYVFNATANREVPAYRNSHGWPMTWVESRFEDVTSANPLSGIALNVNALNDPNLFQLLSTMKAAPSNPGFKPSWIFTATPTSVDYFACVVNFLTATFILAFVFFASRFRSRRQRGFKFSLLEVAAFMLLASIALANYQYHRSLSKNERQLVSDCEGSIVVTRYEWQCPAAIRSLVGEPEWMNVYRHVDQFEFEASRVRDSFAEELGTFAYAKSVRIYGDPSLSHMEGLSGIHGLESLDVDTENLFSSSYLLNTARLTVNRSTRLNNRLGYSFSEQSLNELVSEQIREASLKTDETQESGIQQPNAVFRSVTALSINSRSSSSWDRKGWTRSLDFVSCCPNLKKITLVGDQYLMDDLMNIPATIEEINFGFPATLECVEKLQKKYPGAVVNPVGDLPGKVLSSQQHWEVAQIRVNRRRSRGWIDSQFQYRVLDLSSTEVDREFLQKLSPVFSGTGSIIFGSFDSAETAVWLTQQCPKLKFLKTNGFPIGFAEAMQLPKSLTWLVIEQGSISAEEFATLAGHFELKELKIKSSDFTDHEIEEIRAANPDCTVKIRRTPRRRRVLSK